MNDLMWMLFGFVLVPGAYLLIARKWGHHWAATFMAGYCWACFIYGALIHQERIVSNLALGLVALFWTSIAILEWKRRKRKKRAPRLLGYKAEAIMAKLGKAV